ncbi:fungal-specific transcription factor domain-containing protein [Aspergillus transmontanensis]|uniref:Fungal-specific transcription factor domain-containing protein n=1 Tax=Aspergillus transmontanensis TaxID=1034304 RepID=A0A5N6VQ51_9EURO|nr:fungal-specific transcription factor domain-containing protein [Aspergillus transmontanensis]
MSPENSDAGPEEVTKYVVAVANRHEAEEATLSDRNNYDHEIQPTSTGSSQTKCSICHSTFRRPEHLKRHFRSHTKEKPFECTQCGRHFSRTDTLHRHELSHHTLGPEGGKDRTHRITVKTFRACFKCAVARVRCSGGTPCIRCGNRSLECQYPTERRSKAKARKQSSRNQDSVDGSPQEQVSRHARSPSAANTDITLALNGGKPSSQIPGYQLGQFQIQLSGQSSSKTTSSSREHLSEHLSDPQDSRQTSEPENLDLSNSNGVINVTRFPFDSYAGVNIQQLYPQMPTSDIRATLSGDQGARLNHQVQPEIPGSNINMGMVVAHNQQLQLGFIQPYLDPAMASTINWLSNDLLLDTTGERPTGDRPLPHSSQGGTINSSLGQSSWLPPVISAEQTSPSLPEHIYQTPGNTSLGTDVDSPRHFPRDAAQSSTPQSRPCNASQRSADSYIDGGGARLPKYRRKQDPGLRPASLVDVRFQLRPTGGPSRFSFPIIQELREETSSEEVTFKFQIEPAMYDNIYQGFTQLCCTENFLYSKFDNKNFPPREALSHFIGLYFDSFQTVYPILHGPTFNPNACHWLLTMAVSAIGSYAAGIDEQANCSAAFHEFLRRAIHIEKEKCRPGRTPLWLMQATMLNCVGLLHGSNEHSRDFALDSIGELVNLSTREGLLCASTQSRLSPMGTSQDTRWAIWIEDETRKRTGYFIWLLDCMLAYHFESRLLLSLDDGQAPLPSGESLWRASSADAWARLYEKTAGREEVSLYNAVLTLYIEKKLVANIGEFGHILLVHALYHRMWEVGDYFRRPLSFWNPTAKKQPREAAIPSGSVWLPGIPSYSRWRNSACDCLDILHWAANSTIAKASGLEHPTVLHLHEARIILLVPFHEIKTLVTSLAAEKVRWSARQQTIEWHYILRWIKHDQYKARLAVIHAGASLWHVRRYSTDAFHEPVAVFLAILTLWAYGMCHSQVFPDIKFRGGPDENLPSEPTFFHIDRPCDDELVQIFVRGGQGMKGNVTGVGDICAPEGPKRILQVGCETLAGLTSWGISKRFIAILTRLGDLMSCDK